ncbi:uncharacterized protein LOC143569985 [Bidens hawaiensis]|uniref:uncharacterized protein LOC143569985 n=1 Tax=Bidens hawaiensis TaxID=980011 RepID=UPI00404B8EBF
MNQRNNSSKGKRRSHSSSPTRNHHTTPSASLLDSQLVTEEEDQLTSLTISDNNKFLNPRSFPYAVKQQCWDKADKIKGYTGCLCHDYDHILPYSKGGQSALENCQVLQATVNRSKGNRTEISRADLIQKSSYCRVSGRDMDLLELAAYGNVRRGQDSGGCILQ